MLAPNRKIRRKREYCDVEVPKARDIDVMYTAAPDNQSCPFGKNRGVGLEYHLPLIAYCQRRKTNPSIDQPTIENLGHLC